MLMASCVLQDPGLQESAPGGRKIRQPADRNQTGGHRAAAEHFPDAGSVSVVCLILYLSKNSVRPGTSSPRLAWGRYGCVTCQ